MNEPSAVPFIYISPKGVWAQNPCTDVRDACSVPGFVGQRSARVVCRCGYGRFKEATTLCD